jgi:hypothetical protein
VTFDANGRALRCATEILAGAKDIGLDLRAGVHTGEVEVLGDDIAGLAVTIAKRVCDLAGPGQVCERDGAGCDGGCWHPVRRSRRTPVEGDPGSVAAFRHGVVRVRE